jgi:limonene-1,2-epoxide hydrolase
MVLAFRKAVEKGDLDGAIASLAPDVVLHSPVTFKPIQGKEAVAALALRDSVGTQLGATP